MPLYFEASSAAPAQAQRNFFPQENFGCWGSCIFRPVNRLFQRIKNFLFRTPHSTNQNLIKGQPSNSDRARSFWQATQNTKKPDPSKIINDALNTLTKKEYVSRNEIENLVNVLTEMACNKGWRNFFSREKSRIESFCASFIHKRSLGEEQLVNFRKKLVNYVEDIRSDNNARAPYLVECLQEKIDSSLKKILRTKIRKFEEIAKAKIFHHVDKNGSNGGVSPRERYNTLLFTIYQDIASHINATLTQAPGLSIKTSLDPEDFLFKQMAVACAQKEFSDLLVTNDIGYERVYNHDEWLLPLALIANAYSDNKSFGNSVCNAVLWSHMLTQDHRPNYKQVQRPSVSWPSYREDFIQTFGLSSMERSTFDLYYGAAVQSNRNRIWSRFSGSWCVDAAYDLAREFKADIRNKISSCDREKN